MFRIHHHGCRRRRCRRFRAIWMFLLRTLECRFVYKIIFILNIHVMPECRIHMRYFQC